MPNPSATLFSPEEEEETWAIVELMGRSRVAGRISRDTQFGTGLLMLDVPYLDGFVRQFVGAESAIFRLTLCEEEVARSYQMDRSFEPDISLAFKKFQDVQILRDAKEMLSPSYDPDFSVGEVDPFGTPVQDSSGNTVAVVYRSTI